jgi:hypothetical protein
MVLSITVDDHYKRKKADILLLPHLFNLLLLIVTLAAPRCRTASYPHLQQQQ